MDFPLIAELNRFVELFQSVLLDFTFSSIVLNIYCFEILLKSEEVRQSRFNFYDWKEEGR